MSALDYDAVVIGAGVVGLACAARLARDRRVLVIERHSTFGRQTSSRSSEVVHAGLYYPPGSQKAALCVAGNRSLRAFCERRGIGFAPVGKHVVATNEAEEARLEDLRTRALTNGVADVEIVGPRRIAAREPNVIARAALWSPSSAIVDSHALMAALFAEARSRGCDFAFRHEVVGAERLARGYALHVRCRDDDVRVRGAVVVNAAGLHADEVAALVGIDVEAAGYRQRWVKGRHARLRRRGLVRSLVYPLPPPDLEGLGVHVTVDLGGGIRLGPDVVPLASRTMDLHVGEEIVEPFFAAVSRYLRGLSRDDLAPDQAGIRPKLALRGAEPADFVIAEESARGLPGWVDLVGIESPGLTCCLEIAGRVASIV